MKLAIVLMIQLCLSITSLTINMKSKAISHTVMSPQLVTLTTSCNPSTGYQWRYLPGAHDDDNIIIL